MKLKSVKTKQTCVLCTIHHMTAITVSELSTYRFSTAEKRTG